MGVKSGDVNESILDPYNRRKNPLHIDASNQIGMISEANPLFRDWQKWKAHAGHFYVLFQGKPLKMVFSKSADAGLHLMEMLHYDYKTIYHYWAKFRDYSDRHLTISYSSVGNKPFLANSRSSVRTPLDQRGLTNAGRSKGPAGVRSEPET